MTKLPAQEYLKKPFTRIITPAEEGGFSAEILEFPGCFAEGETVDETYEALEKAATSWIEAALEQGQNIPEPFDHEGYAGKIALRLPRSIHKTAAMVAEREDTSLNQFLLSAISARIGAEEFCNKLLDRLSSGLIAKIDLTTINANITFQVVTDVTGESSENIEVQKRIGTSDSQSHETMEV